MVSPTRTTAQLEQAYVEWRHMLQRRARGVLKDSAAAEDVVQEAFLRAWRNGPEASSPEALYAWLARTAGNLALDELRRRRRRPVSTLESARLAAEPHGTDSTTREVLAKLAPEERVVVLMRFQAGFSSAELGDALGIAETAARKRVERARRRFQREFLCATEASESLALAA